MSDKPKDTTSSPSEERRTRSMKAVEEWKKEHPDPPVSTAPTYTQDEAQKKYEKAQEVGRPTTWHVDTTRGFLPLGFLAPGSSVDMRVKLLEEQVETLKYQVRDLVRVTENLQSEIGRLQRRCCYI